MPLAWALRQGGFLSVLLGVVAITAIGTVASTAFIRATGIDDDQRIVIDEVAGYLVTLSLVDATVTHLVLGFGLFRLFDVWKPAPIRQLDRSVGGGWGVMLDDLVAGIYAALILYAIASLGGSAAIEAWVLGLFGRTA